MRIASVSLSLLLATGLSLVGNGLLATLVAVRLADAAVPEPISGWILACYFAGLTAGTLLLPTTLRRVGNIRAFAAFTALGVAAALAHGFVPVGLGWAPLRAITGLSMAGIYMTVESWLNADARPEQRGRVMAAYLVALYLGNALGQLLLPIWPNPGFEAFAFAALTVSVAAIPVSLTRTTQPDLERAVRLSARELIRLAPLGWWGASLSGFIAGTVYAIVPLAARAEGLTSAEVSELMAAFVLGGLAGQWPIGWLSDRMDRRMVMLLVAAALALCAGGIFAFEEIGFAARARVAFGFGALAFALYPLAVAHTLDRAGDGQSLPAAAQMLLASSIGAVAGPIVASSATPLFGSKALYLVDALLLVGFAFGVAARRARVAAPAQDAFVAVPRTTFAVSDLDPRTHPELANVAHLGVLPEAPR
jgi:MFS family permease